MLLSISTLLDRHALRDMGQAFDNVILDNLAYQRQSLPVNTNCGIKTSISKKVSIDKAHSPTVNRLLNDESIK